MTRIVSKIAAGMLLLAACASCGHQAPPPQAAAPPKAPQVATKDPMDEPGTVQTKDWKIVLKGQWDVEKDLPKPNDGDPQTELVAMTKESYGEGPAVLTIVAAPLPKDMDSKGFVMGVVQQMNDDEDMKILKGKRVSLAGNPGVLLLVLRRTPAGSIAGTVELITSNGKRGYDVACGGDPQHGEEFGPLCLSILKTFEMK